MVKKILLIIALVVLTFSLFGCETLKGIGRDLQAPGKLLEDAAEGVDDRI